MITRNDIIERAFIECMTEMYAKAQPSADYNQLINDYKDGKIDKNDTVYDRYYLSVAEFDYIRKKYIEIYGLKETWRPNIEVLEEYLNNGGSKDKYIEAHTDDNGLYHSGYRGYETVKPIKEQIKEILNTEIGEGNVSNSIANKITDAVMNTIDDCKGFYRFDREESQFSASVALGASPTSNKDTVIKYWKSQGVDIQIEERNPFLIWERDYYGDEFEEVMIDEYGDDWKEQFDQKWEEEKRRKEAEREKWRRKLNEMIEDYNV